MTPLKKGCSGRCRGIINYWIDRLWPRVMVGPLKVSDGDAVWILDLEQSRTPRGRLRRRRIDGYPYSCLIYIFYFDYDVRSPARRREYGRVLLTSVIENFQP